MTGQRGHRPATRVRATLAGLHLRQPARTAVALARRPDLWSTALRLSRRTAARPGFTPSPAYLAFRAEAMLGTAGLDRGLRPAEVVAYLAWCKRMRALGG